MAESRKPRTSALDRIKAQAEVLLPVLKALRAELGDEPANSLVFDALRKSSRRTFEKAGSKRSGSGQQKWRELTAALDGVIADAVEREVLRDDEEAWHYNITGCQFAQYFRGLGEPELGAVLTCEVDHHVVAISEGQVELSRPQTIMRGAKQCHFRYRFKPSE